MMILSIILLIISTLTQGIVSNYIGYTYSDLSIFSTIYVLITLLVISPYFENKKKYLLLVIVFGIIVDIAYTNTLLLNTCLFIVAYLFSKVFHFFFPYNGLTLSISNILSIFIYHIISFIFLSILKYNDYTLSVLLKILTHSVLMTIIYTNIIYYTIKLINQKLPLKEVK